VEEPGVVRPLKDRLPGPADEIPGDPLGEALPGFAVAARLGGDRWESVVRAELLEAVDGVVAGVVIGEGLGEEDAQGDPRGVDPLTPGIVGKTARGRDEGPGKEP
jgi:hypothetical protein